MSNIEWTDATWNPVIGCRHVAEGCRNCYAETMSKRLAAMGQADYASVLDAKGKFSGKAITRPDTLAEPLSWRKPRMVFVNSMSDLFHEDVPFEFIAAVYGVMAACPQHTFQVLTKRPQRMREFMEWLAAKVQEWDNGEGETEEYLMTLLHDAKLTDCDYPLATEAAARKWLDTYNSRCLGWPLPNVWHGVSVAEQKDADRNIPILLKVPSVIRFISAEPLIGPVDFTEWIGYNPPHEQINGQDGSVRVPSGAGRDVHDNRDRRGVARQPAKARGFDDQQWIPNGEDHAGAEASHDDGTSAGVPAFLRSNPSRADDQSQERRSPRQQAGESRGDDLRGADATRNQCAGPEAKRSGRREERHGEADGEGRARDTTEAERGGAVEADSRSLRGIRQNNQQDCERRQVGLHQIIVGGESGPNARPCDVAWIRSIVEQCKAAGVPCFVKQLGSNPVWHEDDEWVEGPLNGRYVVADRKGGDPSEWPEDLRVREFPEVK